MKLTKDALKGALKNVNRLFNEACRDDDKPEIARWGAERTRILNQLNTYDEKTNNG